MAHIVIITHHFDTFFKENYLLRYFLHYWGQSGHTVSVVKGLGNWPDADLAILHVDLTVVPDAYATAAKKYPVVINGEALDMRKKSVSLHLVQPHDDWSGPVIVKSDLNCRGVREARFHQMVQENGLPPNETIEPAVCMNGEYNVFKSSAAVPADVWGNSGLIVERFLPEQDSLGYYSRLWIFFGDRERCTLCRSENPIVKYNNLVDVAPSIVPDEIRQERIRLGFDYGKFDFVIHDGKPVLLDANRTPFAGPPSPEFAASNVNLAAGIEALFKR